MLEISLSILFVAILVYPLFLNRKFRRPKNG